MSLHFLQHAFDLNHFFTYNMIRLTQAAVYKTSTGSCAAFLANIGTKSDATVTFNGKSYRLPAWSVSILPDCKNVAFNTAKVRYHY